MIATDVVFVGAVATCQGTSTVPLVSISLFLSLQNEGFQLLRNMANVRVWWKWAVLSLVTKVKC